MFEMGWKRMRQEQSSMKMKFVSLNEDTQLWTYHKASPVTLNPVAAMMEYLCRGAWYPALGRFLWLKESPAIRRTWFWIELLTSLSKGLDLFLSDVWFELDWIELNWIELNWLPTSELVCLVDGKSCYFSTDEKWWNRYFAVRRSGIIEWPVLTTISSKSCNRMILSGATFILPIVE